VGRLLTLLRQKGGGDPNLLAWYKFDEGSGTTVNDSGIYGHHGTIDGVGTTTWSANGLTLNGTRVALPNSLRDSLAGKNAATVVMTATPLTLGDAVRNWFDLWNMLFARNETTTRIRWQVRANSTNGTATNTPNMSTSTLYTVTVRYDGNKGYGYVGTTQVDTDRTVGAGLGSASGGGNIAANSSAGSGHNILIRDFKVYDIDLGAPT